MSALGNRERYQAASSLVWHEISTMSFGFDRMALFVSVGERKPEHQKQRVVAVKFVGVDAQQIVVALLENGLLKLPLGRIHDTKR